MFEKRAYTGLWNNRVAASIDIVNWFLILIKASKWAASGWVNFNALTF